MGVVVIEHRAGGCLANQLGVGRLDPRNGLGHNLPLCGRRQWNLQVRLHARHAMEGHAAAILQQPDHARRRRVVLLVADPSGGVAVNTSPHRLNRKRSNSYTVAASALLLKFVDSTTDASHAG